MILGMKKMSMSYEILCWPEIGNLDWLIFQLFLQFDLQFGFLCFSVWKNSQFPGEISGKSRRIRTLGIFLAWLRLNHPEILGLVEVRSGRWWSLAAQEFYFLADCWKPRELLLGFNWPAKEETKLQLHTWNHRSNKEWFENVQYNLYNLWLSQSFTQLLWTCLSLLVRFLGKKTHVRLDQLLAPWTTLARSSPRAWKYHKSHPWHDSPAYGKLMNSPFLWGETPIAICWTELANRDPKWI